MTTAPVLAEAAAFGVLTFNFFCGCCLPLLFLAVALVAGSLMEQSHLKELEAAETDLVGMIRTDTKTVPPQIASAATPVEGELVLASVVLSIDHFRNFVTALRKIVGGELGLYRRLAERARREALVRLLSEARARGAVAVINIRFETSNINGVMHPQRNKGTMVEVLAYGTAIRPR